MLGALAGALLALAAPGLAVCPSAICDAPAPSPLVADGQADLPARPPAVPELPGRIAGSVSGPDGPRPSVTLLDAQLPGPILPGAAPPPDEAATGRASAGPSAANPDRDPAGTVPDAHLALGPRSTPRVEPVATEAAPHADRDVGVHAKGQAVPQDARIAQVLGLLTALAAVGLYHRLSKDRLLEHPTRRRILTVLEDQPGLGTNDVADALGVSYRTARHHLDKLARFDLVVEEDAEHRSRWCLPQDAGDLPAPLTRSQAEVLALVDREAGLHLSEIARRLEMAKATAKFQLDRLAERGLVEDEEVGPLRRFRSTEAGSLRLSI